MGNINNIGIIEYRNIIKVIKERHGFDFGHKAFTAFIHSIERTMKLNNIRNTDELISRLDSDSNFIHRFISDISIEETEMFRDPKLWIELREKIIPNFVSKNGHIWVPEVTSGEELLSLTIVLKELNLLEQVKVTATCFGRNQVDIIKSAAFPMKKMETSKANFDRYKSKLNLSDFYTENNNKAYFDRELLRHINIKQFDFMTDAIPQDVDLVLYRNKMIYYNKRMQHSILEKILESLKTGGIFICGIKETLESSNSEKDYIIINKNESIYKKII